MFDWLKGLAAPPLPLTEAQRMRLARLRESIPRSASVERWGNVALDDARWAVADVESSGLDWWLDHYAIRIATRHNLPPTRSAPRSCSVPCYRFAHRKATRPSPPFWGWRTNFSGCDADNTILKMRKFRDGNADRKSLLRSARGAEFAGWANDRHSLMNLEQPMLRRSIEN